MDKWEKEGKVFVSQTGDRAGSPSGAGYTEAWQTFYQHGYDLMEEKFEEMKWF